jgi:hypothetical protein
MNSNWTKKEFSGRRFILTVVDTNQIHAITE